MYALLALDKEGSVLVMIIFDWSAAFNTIDHGFLISRLRDMYGFRMKHSPGLDITYLLSLN